MDATGDVVVVAETGPTGVVVVEETGPTPAPEVVVTVPTVEEAAPAPEPEVVVTVPSVEEAAPAPEPEVVVTVAAVEEAVSATGPTGPTGPYPFLLPTATGPTGPTGPVYLFTIDQLVSQQSVALAQETADRAALCPLTNSGSYNFTPALQAWASAGFPAGYPVVSLTLNAPSPCSDGTTRTSVYEYVSYLTGGTTDVASATQALNTKVLGFTFGYIVSGNTLHLCVNRD